jgi:hypothetical protein
MVQILKIKSKKKRVLKKSIWTFTIFLLAFIPFSTVFAVGSVITDDEFNGENNGLKDNNFNSAAYSSYTDWVKESGETISRSSSKYRSRYNSMYMKPGSRYDAVVSQLLHNDITKYVKGKTLSFSFFAKRNVNKRTVFRLEIWGRYGSSWILLGSDDQAILESEKWFVVGATTYIPRAIYRYWFFASSLNSLKVKIICKRGYQVSGYVDDADIALTSTTTSNNDFGKISIVTNMYNNRPTSAQAQDNVAAFTLGIGAQSKGLNNGESNAIFDLNVKMEMLPREKGYDEWWVIWPIWKHKEAYYYTPQQGTISLRNIGETNDHEIAGRVHKDNLAKDAVAQGVKWVAGKAIDGLFSIATLNPIIGKGAQTLVSFVLDGYVDFYFYNDKLPYDTYMGGFNEENKDIEIEIEWDWLKRYNVYDPYGNPKSFFEAPSKIITIIDFLWNYNRNQNIDNVGFKITATITWGKLLLSQRGEIVAFPTGTTKLTQMWTIN